MNRFLAFTLALLLTTGCASIHKLDSTRLDVITVPDGMKDPGRLRDVQKRISEGEPVVFKVAEGQQMPFRMTMDLPIGTLEKSEHAFSFKRDTYFLMSRKKGFELSPDGQRWASVASPKSLAKLFGFKHGEVSFGFSSVTNQSPFMNVEVQVR